MYTCTIDHWIDIYRDEVCLLRQFRLLSIGDASKHAAPPPSIACSFARVVTTHGSDRFFIVQGYANCEDSKMLDLQVLSTTGVDLIQTIHYTSNCTADL